MQFFFNYCENILKEKTGFQKWNYCVLRGPCLTGYPKQRTGLCSPQAVPCWAPRGTRHASVQLALQSSAQELVSFDS